MILPGVAIKIDKVFISDMLTPPTPYSRARRR